MKRKRINDNLYFENTPCAERFRKKNQHRKIFFEQKRNNQFKNKRLSTNIMDPLPEISKQIAKTGRKCGNCGEIGHNCRKCPNPKIEKVKSSTNAIKNEDTVSNKINEDNNYNELLKQTLSDNGIILSHITSEKPTKDNDYNLQCTEQWMKNKSGTKELSPSSKSDIILSDSTLKIGASIKSGKGRLTSADWCETSAILLSVLENKNYPREEKDKILKIITDIIENMKKVGKHKPLYKHRTKTSICKELQTNPSIKDVDTEWIQLLEQESEKCNNLWSNLIKDHIEYVKDILFECASGEYKFGSNCGRADVLIVTVKNTPDIKKIYSLKNRTPELDEYLISQLPSTESIFACKSGGTGKVMWMRFL